MYFNNKVRQSHAVLSGKVNFNVIEQISTFKQGGVEKRVLSVPKKMTQC